jgi:hypothetical protein
MLEILTLLFPISLFWILEATYLGGWPVDAHGGSGLQQVLGLVVSYVLWVVVWKLLSAGLLGLGPVLGGLMLPTILGAFLLPVTTWIGFKIVGVTVKQAQPAH